MGRSLSASQPSLPSVSSVQPLRRSSSLTSSHRESAVAHWEATLKNRLGTPGPPPPREALPSLYEQRGKGAHAAAALRAVSGVSRSQPPSTVGPSASVVAWFAQFQCNKCGQVPTALDAKFCYYCGEALPLPRVPAAITGGAGSRVAENLGEVAAAAALEAAMIPKSDGRSGGGSQAASQPPQPAKAPASAPPNPEAPVTAQSQKRRTQRSDGVKPRPPRPPGSAKGSQKAVPWGTRESQVAAWLGNIKPRMH